MTPRWKHLVRPLEGYRDWRLWLLAILTAWLLVSGTRWVRTSRCAEQPNHPTCLPPFSLRL